MKEVINSVKDFLVVLTPIILGWFLYQQAKLAAKVKTDNTQFKKDNTEIKVIQSQIQEKQETIHKQINGMQEKLITATGDAKMAQGELKGAADNQAATDAKEQDKK